MTIVASVKVRDGLILATDSMTQIHGFSSETGERQYLKSYENARKLFQIRDLPVGVMTYGLGNIGQRSIEALMLEFSRKALGQRKKVDSIAKALFDFVKGKYAAQGFPDPPPLGFYVAGYSPNSHFPSEWEFLLPQDKKPKRVQKAEEFGATWRGIEHPFTRLWKGFAFRIPNRLAEAGWTQEELGLLLGDLEAQAAYDGMPVQDAVNFAVYILRVTIGYTEFSVGLSPCGGPIQLATVLPDRGFKWTERPELEVST